MLHHMHVHMPMTAMQHCAQDVTMTCMLYLLKLCSACRDACDQEAKPVVSNTVKFCLSLDNPSVTIASLGCYDWSFLEKQPLAF